MRFLARWLFGQAWLVMAATSFFWAANGVASKMVAGQMSPMSVVCLRWLIVCMLLWGSMGGQIAACREQLMQAKWRIVLMGLFGFTAFNALFYLAAYHTSAVNITLLQSAIPAFVLLGAALLQGVKIGPLQVGGLLLTLVSVALIATRGDLANILSLSFNLGDILLLLACLFYAGFTLALRDRPKVPGLVFFSALAVVAFVSSVPLLATEIALGQSYWPSLKGWLILAFIALGPSLASQMLFMRGVELIGASRAGIFTNLVPIFGAGLAVLVLHEEFHFYHALALALGLVGISLSEISARRGAR